MNTAVNPSMPTVLARPSLVAKFATKYNVESDKLLTTLKQTAFKVS